MKILLVDKVWKFVDSFSDFNLTTIKTYMTTHDKIDSLIEEYNDKLILLQSILPEGVETFEEIEQAINEKKITNNQVGRIYSIDSKLEEIQKQIRIQRTTLLVALCKGNRKKLIKFCENKIGVTYGLIREAVKQILDRLGSFTDYWNSCHLVEEFSFRKPFRIFKTKYMLHSMECNTLIRGNLADMQIKSAFGHEKKLLEEHSWDDICKFVSLITRPKKQEFEFSFSKSAFINYKDLTGLNHSDRLEYYMEKLEKSWDDRAKHFEKLPLNIAIGVIKSYWKKKTI